VIVRAFRFASYAFALTIVLAGLADSAGSALGGAATDVMLAACIIVLALGAGMVRPGPCGSLHLVSAVALGAAAWILPSTPRIGAAALLLGSVLPLAIVGRRFGQALAGIGPGGAALPVGLFFGLLAAGFGTGPWLYLLMIFGILWPPPAAAEPDHEALPAPSSDRIALFLISFAAGVLWVSMRPMVTLFDSENVLQDTRRMVTVGLAFAIGWWTLGAAIADGKKLRWIGASALAAAAAIGFRRTVLTTERLNSPQEYTPIVGSDRLLELLGRSDRLTEIDDAFVPWLTLVLAAFPVIAIAASLRAAAGNDSQDARWPVRLGLCLIGIGAGVLVTVAAGLPLLDDALPSSTFVCLLIACVALAYSAGRKIGLPSGIAIAAAAWIFAGPPSMPVTGHPYYDLHTYKVARNANDQLAQHTTASAYARIVERQTPTLPGSYQLFDGRNQLTPVYDETQAWEVDALFPLLLSDGSPKRALLIGAPHAGTLASLRTIGTQEVHLAIDPPELAELAWGFTPEWAGLSFDGLSSTAARAEGKFDFALLRETALWDPQRARSVRQAALHQLGRKLNPGGVAAVVLDPRRAVPGLASAIAEGLGKAVGSKARVFVVPHSFFTPSILIVARKPNTGERTQAAAEAFQFRVRVQLRDRGFPLHKDLELDLLETTTERDESDLFGNLLSGPLPHLALALSATAPFRAEDARPWKRSASVLGRLGAQGSLAWVLGLHEGSQVWSLKDTQVVPREDKIDLSREALEGLLALCKQHPDSEMLRFLAESFGYSAVRKREVEWAYAFMQGLVEDLGWRTPWLLVSYGETLHEMLEPEAAEALAEEALLLRPGFEPAIRLRAIARGEADPFLESRSQHEGHSHR
jgi:hypothetical protein